MLDVEYHIMPKHKNNITLQYCINYNKFAECMIAKMFWCFEYVSLFIECVDRVVWTGSFVLFYICRFIKCSYRM